MDHETVIELFWYRFGPGKWTASVTDDATGTTYEVRRMAELKAALQTILEAPVRRAATLLDGADEDLEETADVSAGS